ncbi:unnamed protein product [Caenorhabditis angaria]|uniref:Seven TM Receptor n=1 Tax=Caenorhabditis angaria TaxID=860376 RepID=A0A9P1ITB1_9PELO|nr:unnamed protein product [Caenorhabditis angaria]
MSILYEFSFILSVIGLFLTLILNPVVIYITLFKIQKILGIYRNLIVIAALLGLCFSILDILVHPFFHSYNEVFFYFTFQDVFGDFWMLASLLLYAFLHSSLISFIAVQFIYRYFVVTNNPRASQFQGCKLILWVSYAFSFGLIYTSAIFMLCPSSSQEKEQLRETFIETYNVLIEKTHGFVFVGNSGMAGSGSLLGVVVFQFSVMVFCGIRMNRELEKNQNHMSNSYKNLQKQFLKVLVFQISGPCILFYLPLVPIFFAPLFKLKFSFESGVLISTFSLFPPIDSMILMSVVTEYRKSFKNLLKKNKISGIIVSPGQTIQYVH